MHPLSYGYLHGYIPLIKKALIATSSKSDESSTFNLMGSVSSGSGDSGGDSITVDSALSSSSANPVQNKVIKLALDNKADKSTATSSADGLMSSTDKQHLDAVYADYTAMLALI